MEKNMMHDPKPEKDSSTEFEKMVQKKVVRHQKGKRNPSRVLFGMGMFGLVGWTIAIYTILGIVLGSWIDRNWDSSYSWTLTLLIIGLISGIMNAWIWINKEIGSSDDDQKKE
jgi:ATP synthase protein I